MQPIISGSPSPQGLMPSRNLAMRPSEGALQSRSKQSIGHQLLPASRNNRVEMEQESEGGQVAAAAAMQAPDVDSKVRTEVNLGIQQIRTIEQHLRTAPQGLLARVDASEAQALRMTLLSASAIIMGNFSNVMRWLSDYPPNSSYFRNDNFSASDRIRTADSPLMSTSTYDSDPSHSPRHRVHTAAASSKQQVINPTSPVISPCHTPHSVSGMSEDSANPASPLVNSDAEGDAAAVAAATATTGTAAAGAGRARRPANEATTSAEASKQKTPSVKRKFMPKFNCQQRTSDPGHDGPPDDGYTWRKYGQKDILGSRNPRSYYRCTHKNELGCPAIKYVQRCDEDSMLFDVTYRGNHTCQSIHQQHPAWQIACFPEQMAIAMNRVNQLPPSQTARPPAMVNYSCLGGNHVSSSAVQSQVTRCDEMLLGGNRHSFSQLASGLPMGAGVPSTVGILDISKFSLNPATPIDLGIPHQDFPAKPEDNNPSQSSVFDTSRLVRDSMLCPDLFNMMLASSRSCPNDVQFTLADEAFQSEIKRVKVHHNPMEPARSSSDNSRQMEKSAESQYQARWGAELDAEFQVQIEGQISGRYGSNSSIISDGGQSRPALPNNQTTQRGRIASMKESDNSVDTPVSSLPMVPAFIDEIDYEPFTDGQSFYG